jgi:hypothetical protein
MSVLSEVSPARAASAPQAQAWNPIVCETVLSWLHTPPAIALGWSSAEWEEARWSIAVHGISPLLYHQLHATPAWTFLAPELRQWLTEQYGYNGERTRRLKAELEQVLGAAQKARIPVVPLKGSATLYTLYATTPALRPMADMDLMVRSDEEGGFTDLLYGLGYLPDESTPRHRTFSHPAAQKVVYTRGEHPDNPRGIQLHTQVSEQFWGSYFDVTDTLWQGSAASFGSAYGWLSAPLGMMQHLLIHTSADVIAGKARLIRFYDIALLAKQLDAEQWQTLVQAATEKQEARWFYTSLTLSVRYLKAEIPAWVLEALENATPPGWREFLSRSTLYHLSFCNPLRVSLQERLMWHRPGRERTVALWHCLFPAPTQLREYHPEITAKGQLPLAYVRHLRSMADGFRRSLLRLPRRSWIRREQGGK